MAAGASADVAPDHEPSAREARTSRLSRTEGSARDPTVVLRTRAPLAGGGTWRRACAKERCDARSDHPLRPDGVLRGRARHREPGVSVSGGRLSTRPDAAPTRARLDAVAGAVLSRGPSWCRRSRRCSRSALRGARGGHADERECGPLELAPPSTRLGRSRSHAFDDPALDRPGRRREREGPPRLDAATSPSTPRPPSFSCAVGRTSVSAPERDPPSRTTSRSSRMETAPSCSTSSPGIDHLPGRSGTGALHGAQRGTAWRSVLVVGSKKTT